MKGYHMQQIDHVIMTVGDEHICMNCRRRWGFDDGDVPLCDAQNEYDPDTLNYQYGVKHA